MKKEERVAMDIRCHGNPMSSAATGSETSQMHTSKRCRSHFVNGHKLCLNLPAKSLRSNSNISLCAFSSTSTKVFTKSLRISWRLIFAVTLFQFVHQVQGQQWVVAPSNTSAHLGETVTLRCEGKDLGSRSTEWRQYSDAGTDRTLFFNDQRVTDNERYSALSNGNGFDLQISQLSRDDDAHYQCSFTLSELSVRARLTTLVPPERPSISLNQSTSDLYEGDFLLFECSSNGGNPTPNFRWSREGIYLSESSGGISDAKFGVSRSYLVRQLTKDDHAATFGCDVENEANPGSPEEIALFINVMYAPIVDFGDFNPLVVLDRDDVTLTCNVDAYPAIPANNVIWKKGQEFLGSGFTYLITEIRPSNAGAYTCTASNHAETRAILQVDVQYAPLLSPSFNAGVITGSRVEIKENQSLNVTCSVDANPAVASADIVWKKAGDGEVHRGTVLSFARVNRAHAGEYTCEASNTLRPSGKPAGTGFGTVDVTIIVLYAPGKASVSVPSSVISGQPASLRCSVDVAGVPSADLVWTRLDNGAQLGTGPTYDISATALSDNGDYVCTPANSMGDGVPDTARLDVNEIPQWLLALPTKRTVIISQTDIGLTCRVRGRPVPQLTWYKNGLALDFSPGYYDLTEQQESIDVHSWNLTSTLKFRGFDRYPELGSLRKEDAGNYTCVAGNGLEEAALVSSVLFAVHYPPEVKADAEKVAIDENQSATLVCESHAVPTPTFMWYNGTTPLVTGGRVSIKTLVVDGEYQYRTELTIDDVAEHDLGDYRCAASNVLGERGVSIHLTVQTVPEAPYNLSVVSSTWESVQLKWEAGFNGGYPQTFKIKYQTSDSVADVGSATASKYNVSNLMPSTNYTFFIYGLNQLGDGDFSKSISSTTSAFAIDPPMEVYYDVAKRHLMYQSPSTNLCARVEIHQGKDSWDQYVECADPTSGSIEIDSDWNILNIRVALCLIRRPEVCSEQQMAFIVEEDLPVETIIIVACVCGGIVVILSIVLIVLCCRRYQAKKEYEKAEANQRMQPVLSPSSGMQNRNKQVSGIDNQGMDTSDGVFSTSSSVAPHGSTEADYPVYSKPHVNGYLANGYPAQTSNGHRPNGAPPPPPSYDDVADPRSLNRENSNRNSSKLNNKNLIHMQNMRQHDRSQSPVMRPEDPYSRDRGGESGVSTPDPSKPKKVIYEVVV